MVKLAQMILRSTELSIAYSPCYSIVLMCYNLFVAAIKTLQKQHMKLKTKQIRLSEFEHHCCEVLKKKYGINPSQFIRQAFIEKLKKDVPKIRIDYENQNKEHLPF